MALHLGTGLIETRGEPQLKMPKLEKALLKALDELGWEQTYSGKTPPEEIDPEDTAVEFVLLANTDGLLAVRIAEVACVRDVARHLHGIVESPLMVFTTKGTLFGRRSVEVTCRKFEVKDGEVEELPVMVTHTAEVTDLEHNELRQSPNALRARIKTANDSMLGAEASADLKDKKVYRYKRAHKKVKFSSPRLGRLMAQIETCEAFEAVLEGEQPIVKVVLSGGAKSLAYLKPDELAELEKAIELRPEIARRRAGAGG